MKLVSPVLYCTSLRRLTALKKHQQPAGSKNLKKERSQQALKVFNPKLIAAQKSRDAHTVVPSSSSVVVRSCLTLREMPCRRGTTTRKMVADTATAAHASAS
mmetsp:Transcript_5725/g.10265  ORF Transcript_5725/g.10265 Transcript_5725/m.10265 type:complete len:102 (-) Transcript_5725:21-326(-)